jgi:hypothetical protein
MVLWSQTKDTGAIIFGLKRMNWVDKPLSTPQPKSTSPHCLVEVFLERCLHLQAETSWTGLHIHNPNWFLGFGFLRAFQGRLPTQLTNNKGASQRTNPLVNPLWNVYVSTLQRWTNTCWDVLIEHLPPHEPWQHVNLTATQTLGLGWS